jgi:hypothetical protein
MRAAARPLAATAIHIPLSFGENGRCCIPAADQRTDRAARGGWWLDYAEHATVLALAEVLAVAAGPAVASCELYAAQCGYTSEWLLHLCSRTIPDPGVTSAARWHFWSESVSESPPGAAPNAK